MSTKIDPTKIDPTPRLGTCRPYRGPTRYSDFYWLNKSSVNLQTRAGGLWGPTGQTNQKGSNASLCEKEETVWKLVILVLCHLPETWGWHNVRKICLPNLSTLSLLETLYSDIPTYLMWWRKAHFCSVYPISFIALWERRKTNPFVFLFLSPFLPHMVRVRNGKWIQLWGGRKGAFRKERREGKYPPHALKPTSKTVLRCRYGDSRFLDSWQWPSNLRSKKPFKSNPIWQGEQTRAHSWAAWEPPLSSRRFI